MLAPYEPISPGNTGLRPTMGCAWSSSQGCAPARFTFIGSLEIVPAFRAGSAKKNVVWDRQLG